MLDILRKEGLLESALDKFLLIGTSLEQTSMSVAAFEFLYMEHLHRLGVVAPTLGVDQDLIERVAGGRDHHPAGRPHEDRLAFDFKSLYPSIIRTFNIDPLSRVTRGEVPGAIVAPNGAAFRRQPGILPGILDRFFESRDAAKKAGKRAGSVRVQDRDELVLWRVGHAGVPVCRFCAGRRNHEPGPAYPVLDAGPCLSPGPGGHLRGHRLPVRAD